jgi:hypothetical protein
MPCHAATLRPGRWCVGRRAAARSGGVQRLSQASPPVVLWIMPRGHDGSKLPRDTDSSGRPTATRHTIGWPSLPRRDQVAVLVTAYGAGPPTMSQHRA